MLDKLVIKYTDIISERLKEMSWQYNRTDFQNMYEDVFASMENEIAEEEELNEEQIQLLYDRISNYINLNEIEDNIQDEKEYEKNPHRYNGVSEKDFE